MRNSISSKIYKILKALLARNEVYLYDRTQIWSDKLEKVCALHKLYRRYTVQEYKKIHPNFMPKPNQQYKKELVINSFKQIDILLELIQIYKAGDKNVEEEETKTYQI